MTKESESDRQIRLLTIDEQLKSSTLSFKETKKLLQMKHNLLHPHFLFRRTKLNILISMVCIISVLIAGVAAYSPATSVTSSNLIVLGSTGKLMNYDGTGIPISNISDVEFVGLLDGQVLSYNGTSGLWSNVNQSASSSGNSYSFSNLTDCSFVGLADGNIPFYNATSSKWENQQPFTTGWNATVNQLISAASLSWSKITNANTTVNQLIATYLTSNPLAFSSITNVPAIGSYSYIISADDPVPGNYSARFPNGTIGWSSTNFATVFNSASALGGIIDLQGTSSYTSPWNYGSTLLIQKHETIVNFNNVVLNYTGSGDAIKTVADSGNYLHGIELNNLYLRSVLGNTAVTNALRLDDCQSITINHPYITTWYGTGMQFNTTLGNNGICNFNIYGVQMFGTTNFMHIVSAYQISVFGGQMNGNGYSGAYSGSYGIKKEYSAATTKDINIQSVTINGVNNGLWLDDADWEDSKVYVSKIQIEDCNNGVYIPHNAYGWQIIAPTYSNCVVNQAISSGAQGLITTSQELSFNTFYGGSWLNGTSGGVSDHAFKVKVDRLSGVTPTLSNWVTNPTSLPNATDYDGATATGYGSKYLTSPSSPTVFGTFTYDMGANYLVTISACGNYGMNVTGGSLSVKISISQDGSNWFDVANYGTVTQTFQGAGVMAPFATQQVSQYCRYVQINFNTIDVTTALYSARIVEIHAEDLTS